MIALVTQSPTPAPLILVPQQQQQQQRAVASTTGDEARRRRRRRDDAFPVEEFVEAVQQHRFLYDRNEPDFKNVAMKEAMWEAIGQQFGLSGNKAMSKWRNMRDKYFKVRKQELLNRRLCTPRFRRPVKMWPFYHMMRQVFERKHTPPEDLQSEAAGGHGDIVAEPEFDSTWIMDSNVEDSELASIPSLNTDNSLASGGEDDPDVDTDHEDLETLASLQSSITMARALFHKRCKDFKDAVESFEQHPASTDHPSEASNTFRRDARTQTAAPLPVTAEDGLEHFGLFVAQRLRMVDTAVQARLMSSILKLVVEVPCGLTE
ncbi:uncharacterized protein LOC119406252 isoform X2 [Rhipicephalus sanguineus]|uniref:uncharacterized protein LOC119406252 isoform X2 n=1 Tax=Rhipicephalus sanguineus TaxID=34632 RepID=UPI0018931A74|nr:uncharacterized protein LOC119406252 isoform X2 [Rhipicephalus sanguineus]